MCNWICPKCKKSNHSGCGVGAVTAMYFEPHYINGVNVNPDRNTRTSTIHCHACNRIYRHSTNGEASTNRFIEKYKPPEIIEMDINNSSVSITDGSNILSVK